MGLVVGDGTETKAGGAPPSTERENRPNLWLLRTLIMFHEGAMVFFLATFAKWKSGQQKHLEYISANRSVGRGFRGVDIPGTSVGIRWTGKGIATEKLQHDSCNMYLFHILERWVENITVDRVKWIWPNKNHKYTLLPWLKSSCLLTFTKCHQFFMLKKVESQMFVVVFFRRCDGDPQGKNVIFSWLCWKKLIWNHFSGWKFPKGKTALLDWNDRQGVGATQFGQHAKEAPAMVLKTPACLESFYCWIIELQLNCCCFSIVGISMNQAVTKTGG